MEKLATQKCDACRVGAPTVTAPEEAELKLQVPRWEIVSREGIRRLERAFEFKDFAGALSFANSVGNLAEAEGHHPALLVEWGRVTVTWWTHKIGGLHRNDFVMAARTDLIAPGS